MVKSCCQFTLGFMVVALALFYVARTIESDAHTNCFGFFFFFFAHRTVKRPTGQTAIHLISKNHPLFHSLHTKSAILMESCRCSPVQCSDGPTTDTILKYVPVVIVFVFLSVSYCFVFIVYLFVYLFICCCLLSCLVVS